MCSWQLQVSQDVSISQSHSCHFELVWSNEADNFSIFLCRHCEGKYVARSASVGDVVIDIAQRTVKPTSLVDGATNATVESFFTDQVLPGLIDHDGHLVVHGGTVVTPFGGLMVVGPSGRGKSSLVTALGLAGNPIQNDDTAIIDLTGTGADVRPIYAGIRLLPDTLAHFFPPDTPTSPVSHYATKRRVQCPEMLTEDPAPLAAVLFPTGEPTDRVRLDPLPSARVCMDLIAQSMALDPTDLTRARTRLQQAAEVARRVPGFALTVPRDLAALPAACYDLLDQLALRLDATRPIATG